MKYLPRKQLLIILSASLFTIFNIVAVADEGLSSLTARLDIVGSSGKPTNDILGMGLIGHYRFTDEWYLGVALDHSPGFDYEKTASRVGLVQDSNEADIDASGTMLMISAFAERRYPDESGGLEYFWSLGAGIAETDFDDVQGPLEGGGTFDITTKADTELVIVGSVGMHQQLNENWTARYAFSIDHHLADWQVRDKLSGNTGTQGDYGVYGLRFGLGYQF